MRCKYYCDYCGMAFDTEKECKEHEAIELAEKEKERKRKAISAAKTKIAELTKRDMTDEDFVKELDRLTKEMLSSTTIKPTATMPVINVDSIDPLESLSSSINKIVNEFQDRIEKRAKASGDGKEDAEFDLDRKPKVTTSYWIDGKKVDEDTFRKASLDFGGNDGIADITDITEAIRDLF